MTREAANRVLGQRHFDVQLMGGAALHFGWIAEMKTGEGKTLVSTLPAYLNGLTGQGMHIVTVNDYLATFHSEWMGRLHNFLGLDGRPDPRRQPARPSGAHRGLRGRHHLRHQRPVRLRLPLRQHGPQPRRHGPARPRLRHHRRGRLDPHRRGPHAADHLGPAQESAKLVRAVRRYRPQRSSATPTTKSTKRSARSRRPKKASRRSRRALGVSNMYDAVSVNYVHQLTQALRAKELYKRDKDYIVMDGEVKIVDEFTGRIMEGRRWSDGLHQAVEAKENVHRQRRGPHVGHRHAAELLPHVRQVGGHDRYGRDRGLGVRQHVRPRRRARSPRTSR